MISEYIILSYIRNHVPTTLKELLKALATTEGDKEEIQEKVITMQRFDLIIINDKGEIRLT